MIFPIKQIGQSLVVFAGDYQWMASVAFVIKIRENIDVHLKLILVHVNIVGRDSVWEGVEMGALKHFFCRESLEYNASLGDLLVRGSKEARSQSSDHPRFGC